MIPRLEILEGRDLPDGLPIAALPVLPSPLTVNLFAAEAQIAVNSINAAVGAALIQASTLGPRGLAQFVPQIVGIAEQALSVELALANQFVQQFDGLIGGLNGPQ